MRFGYATASVRTGIGLPLNLSSPRSASYAASVCVNAMYGLPVPISRMLSTEPPVTSAVADMPGIAFDRMLREAAAERVIDAAGAAGRDRELNLFLRDTCADGEKSRQHEQCLEYALHELPPRFFPEPGYEI